MCHLIYYIAREISVKNDYSGDSLKIWKGKSRDDMKKQKTKDTLRLCNYDKFPSVQVIVKESAYKSLKNAKMY